VTFAYVGHGGGTVLTTTGGTVSLTGTTRTTGNKIFVFVGASDGVTVSSITDNHSNTYTKLRSNTVTGSGSTNSGELWWGPADSAATQITVNLSGTSAGINCDTHEFSATAWFTDLMNSFSGTTGGSPFTMSSAAITPTNANSLVLIAAHNNDFINTGPTGGFTSLNQGNQMFDYKIESGGPASEQATWTGFNTGKDYAGVSVVLSESNPSAGPPQYGRITVAPSVAALWGAYPR
jgi:hypothetical protein